MNSSTIFLTFFLLVLSRSEVAWGKKNCTVEALESCLLMLEKVGQSDNMAFATTTAELDLVCEQLRFGVYCVDKYMTHCFSRAQRTVFNSVVSGSRQTLHDLCIDGQMQKEYLKHSLCYKNVSTDPTRCANDYQRVVRVSRELNNHGNTSNVEDALRKYCCALTDFLRCQYHYTSRDCGQDASRFLHLNTERMSGPLIHQHCVMFTYHTGSCNHPSTNLSNRERYCLGETWLLIAIVSLTTFILTN